MHIKLLLPFFAAALAYLAPSNADAAPELVIVRADVICLPKIAAKSFLESPDLKQRPDAVLGKLRQLIASHQAVSLGNSSFQAALGFHGHAVGVVDLSSETKGANLKNFTVTAEIKYSGQSLTISSPAASGTVLFAGTFEPAKDAPAAAQGGACLVFMQLQ